MKYKYGLTTCEFSGYKADYASLSLVKVLGTIRINDITADVLEHVQSKDKIPFIEGFFKTNLNTVIIPVNNTKLVRLLFLSRAKKTSL